MSVPSRADFDRVVADNEAAIYRLCRAYVRDIDEARDLCQEVLINVWKALPGFRGSAKLSTWIYRIAVNTAITHRRKSSRREATHAPLGEMQVAADEGDKHHKMAQEDRLQRMHEAIGTLADEERLLIGLFLEDLSYKEIGEVMGRDTNYVGVKLMRVKEKLSKILRNG